MKRNHVLILAALLVAVSASGLLAVSGNSAKREEEQPNTAQLVVHEWVTVTRFSGADGKNLHFPHKAGDLPGFVYHVHDDVGQSDLSYVDGADDPGPADQELPAECGVLPPPSPVDGKGDPLPPGALARMGEVRLRHGYWVHSLVYLPDGKTLASAGQDGAIRLWDAATGKRIRTMKFLGNTGEVKLALSPDGKTLASASDEIQLWETATGKEICRIPAPVNDPARSVAFSPDGKTLASGSDDGTIRLWDTASGKEIRVLRDGDTPAAATANAPFED